MINLLSDANNAIITRQFSNGLTYYSQSNCACTLTDQGYRIYRPPNLVYPDCGNTVWGGFVLRDAYEVIKGHRYMFKCHVKGETSNASEQYWSNLCGWSGSSYGLPTKPTIHFSKTIPANFNGEMEFMYDFTVSDDVWKTCTKSYSYFVAGTSYNCYRDFKIGWTYTSTGTLGTDIYITDIRMYDKTTGNPVSVNKNGCIYCGNIIDTGASTQFYDDSEIITNNFIEI